MTTVDIPPKIHKKLKREAVRRNVDLKDVVAEKLQVFVIVALFTAAIGFSAAYAEVANFQFETDNLNSTTTFETTSVLENGQYKRDIFALWSYIYDNQTMAEHQPQPVKGDPVGRFFELLLDDGAGIFKAVVDPIVELIEEVEEIIEEIVEPEPEYTHEEQVLINNVHKYCDELSDRLEAIGLALDFEYETDEFYAKHEIDAKKDSEDCRARLHLGNNVLSSMYNALAEEAKADAIAFNETRTTDISKKNDADYSIQGDMWQKRADEALIFAQTTLVDEYGYGKTYDENYQGDPLYSTIQNRPSDEQVAQQEHEQRENANLKAWKSACNTYWIDAGQGSLASTGWDDHLLNGDCDGRILDPSDPRLETYLDITAKLAEKIADEEREAEELRQSRLDAIEVQDKAAEEALVQAGIRNSTSVNGTGN